MRNYQSKSNLGSLPDSITSTRFGAGEFNSLATENENAVTTSGQTLAAADGTGEVSNQLARALAIYGAGGAAYHLDTGAVNAYVLTPVSPKESPNAYFNGFSVVFEPGTVNTTVSTVNVGSLGVKSITLQNGTALSGGEISGTCCLKYNLGDDRFELIYSSDSFLSISNYYEIDATQADQGATSTNPNTMTIYDVATLVGTSKFATIHLSHNPAAGNQTLYTFDTSLDLSSYPFLFFYPDPGAKFNRTTGDEVFTIFNTENFLRSDLQAVTDVDMIDFSTGGTITPEFFSGGTNIADNLNPIQYAINSISSAGGTVKFMPGNYVISSYVEITADLTHFLGAGANTTYLIVDSATSDVLRITGASAANLLNYAGVRDMTFTTTSADPTAGAGIKLTHCAHAIILDTNINTCRYGVHLTGSGTPNNASIKFNRVRAVAGSGSNDWCGFFMDATYANYSVELDSCLAWANNHTGSTKYGFFIDGNTTGVTSDNWLINCETSFCSTGMKVDAGALNLNVVFINPINDQYINYGIHISNFADDSNVRIVGGWQNSAISAPTVDTKGIYVYQSVGVSITNGVFFGGPNYAKNIGIQFDASSDCSVQGAICRNNLYNILLNDSHEIVVSASTLYNISGQAATVSLYSINSNGCIFSQNVVSGYATTGILLDATTTNFLATGNRVNPTNITTTISDLGANTLTDNIVT